MADYKDIAGRIRTTASDGISVEAQEILDISKNKKQSQINAETDTTLANHASAIQGLNSQSYKTYAATDQTTAETDVLPADGSEDTIYRLGNWDGTQYDVTCYSEYSWNGSAYVHISTKSQIGEVFDISAYHATGGTLAIYSDLNDALNGVNGGVPQSLQKGGMSIKFVHTSDNKYVQARCMAQTFTADLTQWQNVDDKITELALKTDNIEKEVIEETTEAVDFYNNNKTVLLHHIGDDEADFKNLKSNGKTVVVEDDLTDFATKESVQSVIDKTNKIEEETTQQEDEEIVFGETKENPTAKFTKDALMVKKLTDLNGNEIGSVFAVIVEGTNVTISFGGLIYELGYNSNTANNTFDFKRILIGNTEIFNNTSDILGPWWVAAVNNADGDNQTPSFTGGGHTYSGGNRTDESATITSTLESILINGNKVISYSGNAALIDIYWTNLVQAYNTKKADGSGRAVLQENYHLSFDGSHFNVENDIELLEDVVVGRYYGMELWGANKENRTIVYDGARETSEYAGSVDSNSGDTYCFAIHRHDTNYNLEQVAEMQRVGLGEFYLDDSYSAFTVASTGKSYFNITRKPVNFSQGQRLIYKGSYTFKKL